MNVDIDQGRPPPSNAIFKFLLKVELSSHAGRPPGIAATLQTFNSVKHDVAVACSLEKEGFDFY